MVGKLLRLNMTDDLKLVVPHYSDFVFDQNHIKDDARRLMEKLRPHWDASTIEIKQFTEGITNWLIGCFPLDFDSDKSEKDDVVLIRVYGRKTELFIDRQKEIANMLLMYQNGLSPPVFCSFANGMAYGYSAGKVVDSTMVRQEYIYNLICHQMVKMHSISYKKQSITLPICDSSNNDDNNNNSGEMKNEAKACLSRLFNKYLTLIAESITPDDPVSVFLNNEGITLDDLTKEADYLVENLSKLGSPLVFCHNDLLLNNIIYDERKPSISFIDFEYADINYQAFDIANHFNEFSGVDEYIPEMYPSKEFQLKWLSCYLKHWNQLVESDEGDIHVNRQFDLRVEDLYVQVSKFSLASNLLWGIWALLQTIHSTIDFNFFAYGVPRIREYFKRKHSLLSLSSPIKKHVS
ncbi:ethanolamine kinase 1 [Tetranychus urticae]|uniref:ethanolamine kinase n=1 Tax=Tetranychus urticae TaxID=32264 RepID=T1K200_TETUR|nr:ethanolamine kinase 1 [Tetranychus urticae]